MIYIVSRIFNRQHWRTDWIRGWGALSSLHVKIFTTSLLCVLLPEKKFYTGKVLMGASEGNWKLKQMLCILSKHQTNIYWERHKLLSHVQIKSKSKSKLNQKLHPPVCLRSQEEPPALSYFCCHMLLLPPSSANSNQQSAKSQNASTANCYNCCQSPELNSFTSWQQSR